MDPTGPMELRPHEGVWLNRVKVANFRAIASLDLEFRHRLTLLIGDNGSGKTSVLDAIAKLLVPNPTPRGHDPVDVRKSDGEPAADARIDLEIFGSNGFFTFGPHGQTVTNRTDFGNATEVSRIIRASAHYAARRDLTPFTQL